MKRILQQWSVAMALLTLSAMAPAQEDISTRVTPDEITQGETVTVVVDVYDRQSNTPINISSLEEDFDVVSSRTSSRLRTINGRVQARTRYELVLFPKRTGIHTIPPIEIGNRTSEPVQITVHEPTQGERNNEDLYLETSLSSERIYVQEELRFTIRLYYRMDGIRNPEFTELDMDSTVIRELGPPNQYEQIVDGERYGVYEINYALFPQRSGKLEIPDIFFRAQLSDGTSRSIFRQNNLETITAFTPGHQVEVRSRPEEFPADATWLPARSLDIREEWDRDITNLEPGESATRTITLRADGLDGPALPPVDPGEIDRVNLYPAPPEVERSISNGKIVGSRIRTWSMIPTEPGSVVLPEIRIPWWNTDEDQLEYAVLRETFITVSGPADSSISRSADAAQANAGDSLSQTRMNTPDALVRSPATPVWIFTLMTVFLAGAGVVMTLLYRNRNFPERPGAEERSPAPASAAYRRELSTEDEKQAFQDLLQRCRRGSPGAIRLALIAWARQYYEDPELLTLDGLIQCANDRQLAGHCHRLQQALYAGNHSADLDQEIREALMEDVRAYRKRRQLFQRERQRTEHFRLPPLYRN